MRRISTPGSDESGSILLDTVVALVLISLTLFPLYGAFGNLAKAEERQQALWTEVVTALEERPSWSFGPAEDSEN